MAVCGLASERDGVGRSRRSADNPSPVRRDQERKGVNPSRSPNRRFRPRRSAAGRARIRASCTWFEGLYHTYRQVHRPQPEHDYSQHTMHANMAICTKVAISLVYPTGYSDASLETTARPEYAPALTARLQAHPRWTRGQPTSRSSNMRSTRAATGLAHCRGEQPMCDSERQQDHDVASRSECGMMPPLVGVLDDDR